MVHLGYCRFAHMQERPTSVGRFLLLHSMVGGLEDELVAGFLRRTPTFRATHGPQLLFPREATRSSLRTAGPTILHVSPRKLLVCNRTCASHPSSYLATVFRLRKLALAAACSCVRPLCRSRIMILTWVSVAVIAGASWLQSTLTAPISEWAFLIVAQHGNIPFYAEPIQR